MKARNKKTGEIVEYEKSKYMSIDTGDMYYVTDKWLNKQEFYQLYEVVEDITKLHLNGRNRQPTDMWNKSIYKSIEDEPLFKKYRVKIRRGDGWKVKPESEQIDGKVFEFRFGWDIEDGIYEGEKAMIIKGYNHPVTWMASGDLEEHDKTLHEPTGENGWKARLVERWEKLKMKSSSNEQDTINDCIDHIINIIKNK